MTLLIGIILAAVLLVVGIKLIKKSAPTRTPNQTAAAGPTPPSRNPGSIPDGDGNNKGNGNSAMSSGMQG